MTTLVWLFWAMSVGLGCYFTARICKWNYKQKIKKFKKQYNIN